MKGEAVPPRGQSPAPAVQAPPPAGEDVYRAAAEAYTAAEPYDPDDPPQVPDDEWTAGIAADQQFRAAVDRAVQLTEQRVREEKAKADAAHADVLAQRRTFAPTADEFEAWLKRQRDSWSATRRTNTGYWALDCALDYFRLHGVTGTPLTEPTPTEGHHDE